jgi:hypothetical protein
MPRSPATFAACIRWIREGMTWELMPSNFEEGPKTSAGMPTMNGAPCCRRSARQSCIPASFAVA